MPNVVFLGIGTLLLQLLWRFLETYFWAKILDGIGYLHRLLDHFLDELANSLPICITHFIIFCYDALDSTFLTEFSAFKIILVGLPFFELVDVVHFIFILIIL